MDVVRVKKKTIAARHLVSLRYRVWTAEKTDQAAAAINHVHSLAAGVLSLIYLWPDSIIKLYLKPNKLNGQKQKTKTKLNEKFCYVTVEMIILWWGRNHGRNRNKALTQHRPLCKINTQLVICSSGIKKRTGNWGPQVIKQGDPVAHWRRSGVRGGDRITLSLIPRPLGVSCPLYMAVCKRSAPRDARVADAPETGPPLPSPITC